MSHVHLYMHTHAQTHAHTHITQIFVAGMKNWRTKSTEDVIVVVLKNTKK